jgi:hypothetical protein
MVSCKFRQDAYKLVVSTLTIQIFDALSLLAGFTNHLNGFAREGADVTSLRWAKTRCDDTNQRFNFLGLFIDLRDM